MELSRKGALIRFVGSERNDRWVPLEDLQSEGLGDVVARFTAWRSGYFSEGFGCSRASALSGGDLMWQRGKASTHEPFHPSNQLEADGWEEQCSLCGMDGVAGE